MVSIADFPVNLCRFLLHSINTADNTNEVGLWFVDVSRLVELFDN